MLSQFIHPSEYSAVEVASPAMQDKPRYEFYWYKLRGDETLCCDTGSYGFGNCAYWLPINQIASMHALRTFEVGGQRPSGTHVLVVDHLKQRAYYVLPHQARRFMAAA